MADLKILFMLFFVLFLIPFCVNSMQQWLHTSSIVIDRYSNFGNTYLSKEFARVVGTGHSDVTMWSGPNTRAAILTNNISKSYTIHTNK